jgi:hypothetical protein
VIHVYVFAMNGAGNHNWLSNNDLFAKPFLAVLG